MLLAGVVTVVLGVWRCGQSVELNELLETAKIIDKTYPFGYDS